MLLVVKSSFFVLYLEMFYPFVWIRRLSYISIVALVLNNVFWTVFDLAEMTPRAGESWSQAALLRDNAYLKHATIPSGTINLAFDLLIVVTPMAAIRRLQMSNTRKIQVGAVFLTGLL